MDEKRKVPNLLIPREAFVFSQSQIGRMARENRKIINKRVHSLREMKGEKALPKGSKKLDIDQTREVFLNLFMDIKSDIKHKVHTFYNFKGGTGKTTICYQISTMLAFMGFKVLTIDCDPQAHLTSLLGIPEQEDYPTIYDVLVNMRALKEVTISVFNGLDIIPSSLSLTRIESPLNQMVRRENILLKMLQSEDSKTSQYDFIMIDTNPAFSVLNLNALMACQQLNVVCETHPLSLSGLSLMIEELQRVYKELQKDMNFVVIPNKYEAKTATSQEILGVLRKDYKQETIQTVIRKCEDINVSTKRRLPVLCFANKNSIAMEDIIDLGHEFIALSRGKPFVISGQEEAA